METYPYDRFLVGHAHNVVPVNTAHNFTDIGRIQAEATTLIYDVAPTPPILA
jgi:hypothetical protein